MVEKPDFVQNFQKPKNTEIKKIKNNWYLYERSSKYDPAIKRSRKVSGRCLGKITPDGLQETKRRLTSVTSASPLPSKISDVVEAGAALFFWKRTEWLRLRLEEYFPDCWRQIYVTALLRLLKGPRFKRLTMHYENNLLAYIYPGLLFSPMDNSNFLRHLGTRRHQICQFMRDDIRQRSTFVLFDGHRMITSSQTMPLAEKGYDSKQRFMPQTNLMYIFSISNEGNAPIYYKQYAGSTPDVSAFSDVLKESGLRDANCTVIADKGFSSEADFDLLSEHGLHYVIPLRRGNRFVKNRIPDGPKGYDGIFAFRGRTIAHLSLPQNGFNVFLFHDAQLYADESHDALMRKSKANATVEIQRQKEEKRREQGHAYLTDEKFAELVPQSELSIYDDAPEMGTFTVRTNRTELSAQEVYEVYKQRQSIEQFFKTYGDSLNFEASYMRNTDHQEAWLFLNHISSIIGMDALNDIAGIGENKNISLEDLKQMLGKLMACRIDDEWQIAPVKNSVRRLMEKLNFDLSLDNLKTALTEGTPSSKRT